MLSGAMKAMGILVLSRRHVSLSPRNYRRYDDLGGDVPGQAWVRGGNARAMGNAGGIVPAARDHHADHAAPNEEQVDAAM